MLVDHAAARVALNACDWKLSNLPDLMVFLSEPDENGLAELTTDDAQIGPETVASQLRLLPPPPIKSYIPTTVGYVVSEPHRPPSPGAVAATGLPPPPPRVEAPDPDIVEANVLNQRRK